VREARLGRGGGLVPGATVSRVTRTGAIFLPAWAPETLLPLARAADEAGVDELWVWEDCFQQSGVAAASACLAATTRIDVGIGLMPAPLRTVALTAMEIATLQRLFPGRFRPGIGHGVQSWMGQAGVRAASPLTLLDEQLTALRALLDGQRVSTRGRYVHLDDVALDWPPLQRVPVLAGAEGPRSLQLSGALADGTLLPAGTTVDRLRAAREQIDIGRERAGRTDHHDVTVFVPVATGPGAQQRLDACQARWGFDGPGWGAAGDAEQVAQALRGWAGAGADAVALQPTDDDPDPASFMAFAAEVGLLLS
jgi:alkanesulfonate monooxygenase SsuD/methylene tetrahydromethanopterin reductase-like flavin-dependent oxidoreductase (luciferase family)